MATDAATPASPNASVASRPPSSPCSGELHDIHSGAMREYTNGITGPCVKKKSRYGMRPARTDCAAYMYHPSSWFRPPHHTATAAMANAATAAMKKAVP